MNELAGILQFGIVDNGIDRYIHLDTITMSILTELSDVIDRIPRSSPGTMMLRTNVDGIGSMIDSSHTTLQILGRCQQFK